MSENGKWHELLRIPRTHLTAPLSGVLENSRGNSFRILYQEEGRDPEGNVVRVALRMWTNANTTDVILTFAAAETITDNGWLEYQKGPLYGDTVVLCNLHVADVHRLTRLAGAVYEHMADGQPVRVERTMDALQVQYQEGP